MEVISHRSPINKYMLGTGEYRCIDVVYRYAAAVNLR